MYSIYIHSDFIFRGSLNECENYYYENIANTFDEVFFELIKDEEL